MKYKITAEADELLRFWYNNIQENKKTDQNTIINKFKYLNPKMLTQLLTYLQGKGYIDFIWTMGHTKEGHQRFLQNTLTPDGIEYIEQNLLLND